LKTTGRVLSIALALSALALLAADSSVDNRVVIHLTYDDGPDVYTPDLAQWLHAQKDHRTGEPVHALFFVNICRFQNNNPPTPYTGNCAWFGHEPSLILAELVGLGHEVGNHTYDHVDLTQSGLTQKDWAYQMGLPQEILDPYQRFVHFFRAPYLKWNDALDDFVKSDPYLKKMTGPVGCDVCGNGYVNNVAVGGDFDCLAQGYSVEVCGDVYLAGIEAAAKHQHSLVVLMHDRLQGAEGTNKALLLTQYVVTHLPPARFRFAPLHAKVVVASETF
jgi:peptidoglycan/xylan/chitin deacetylase (PgdA/CDA1 family)